MAKSQTQRIADLTAAKKQFARSKRLLTWDELAELYGLTKPAFHNLSKTIPNWPEPAEKKGLTHYFHAHSAIVVLLAYLKRREAATAAHAKRLSALMAPEGAEQDGEAAPLSAAEQLKAWEVRDRLRKEAIEQGHLHRADQCAATSEKVFGLISRTFGKPTTSMDPAGLWAPEIREAIDKAGEQLVLRCYAEMKHMLGAETPGTETDADRRPPGSKKAGGGRRRTQSTGKARKS